MEITEIKAGMTNEAKETVTDVKTAKAMGSGSLEVYATPAMLCLMEKAAAELAEEHLPSGWTSVGCSIQASHEAPSPLGAAVRAVAEVTAVEGRKLVFSVTAYDAKGIIGRGQHERFAVLAEKFMHKASDRKLLQE